LLSVLEQDAVAIDTAMISAIAPGRLYFMKMNEGNEEMHLVPASEKGHQM
jgi:hypothetical protein